MPVDSDVGPNADVVILAGQGEDFDLVGNLAYTFDLFGNAFGGILECGPGRKSLQDDLIALDAEPDIVEETVIWLTEDLALHVAGDAEGDSLIRVRSYLEFGGFFLCRERQGEQGEKITSGCEEACGIQVTDLLSGSSTTYNESQHQLDSFPVPSVSKEAATPGDKLNASAGLEAKQGGSAQVLHGFSTER